MPSTFGSKAGDMVVNIARTKNLGNQRSSTSDISVQLVPPRTFSLEEALEYSAMPITPHMRALVRRYKAQRLFVDLAGADGSLLAVGGVEQTLA